MFSFLLNVLVVFKIISAFDNAMLLEMKKGYFKFTNA